MDAKASTITFTLPEWLDVGMSSESFVVYINGTQCDTKLYKWVEDSLTVTSPINVNAFEEVHLAIVPQSKYFIIGSPSCSMSFVTSSEPELVECKPFIIKKSYESSLIKCHSTKCGETFACSFILESRELDIDLNTKFELVLPPGMRIPESVVPGHFLINGCSPKNLKRLSSIAISFRLSEHARVGEYQLRSIRFLISPHAGIRNPNITGLTTIRISVDGSLYIHSEPIHFTN